MPKELTPKHPSRPLPSPRQANYEHTCTGCGNKVLSKGGQCPNCGGSMQRGDEMTKKVVDDNDLRKGGW